MRARVLPLCGFLLLTAAMPLEAQSADAARVRLVATTTNDGARMHVHAGMDERAHPYPLAARRHFDQALAQDPTLPLALAGKAMLEPGLSGAQRAEAIERAIAARPNIEAAELALMLAWREQVSGRPANAMAFYRVAEELAPGEPAIAFEHALRQPAGAERVAALQRVVERFPDYGPAHNILAYQLYGTGDRTGGVRHVREYVRLFPNHPNALDSYGEIMVWEGDYGEAERAYRRALEVDPEFAEARNGLAEVYLVTDRGDEARALLTGAMNETADADERMGFDFTRAVSRLFEGDARGSLRDMERIAEEASERAPGASRYGYWFAAMIAAHAGDAQAARRLMALAAEQEGEPDASLPLRRVMAAPRDAAVVRSVVQELEAAVAGPNAAGRLADDLRFARVIEAARSADFARAEAIAAEIVNPSFRQLGRAFVAEAMDAAGRTADARRIAAEILASPDFSINGALARAKAGEI